MPGNNQRLLEGEVIDTGPDPSEFSRLRDELRRAVAERDALRGEVIRLRQRVGQIEAPAAQLRQTLEPLYGALRAIMGEIEVIDPQPDAATPPAPAAGAPQDSRAAAVWESWKQQLGETPALIIGALQTHGEANTGQLAIICKKARQTISDGIFRLNKAGLINKNGGRFSLKQL